MSGRYERIVIRSDAVVITSKGTALRSRLRSIAGRDVDTWSSVVFSRSLVVDVRYELVGTARDAMTICEDRVTPSSSGMAPLRPDQGERDSRVEEDRKAIRSLSLRQAAVRSSC